jgi:hypothetical protein
MSAPARANDHLNWKRDLGGCSTKFATRNAFKEKIGGDTPPMEKGGRSTCNSIVKEMSPLWFRVAR